FSDANQFIANICACTTDRRDLCVLCIRIGNLAIAGNDYALKFYWIDEDVAGQIIHALYHFWQGVAHDKIYAVFLKCLNGSGCAWKCTAESLQDAATS